MLYYIQLPRTGEKYKIVSEITHLLVSVLYCFVKKAKAIVYNSEHDLQIEKEHVASIKPLGLKRIAKSKAIEDKVIALIKKDKNDRKFFSKVLGF